MIINLIFIPEYSITRQEPAVQDSFWENMAEVAKMYLEFVHILI